MFNIQNRRYLGNKYRLLEFIDEVMSMECPEIETMMDIFAGTGVVAHHFMDRYQVVTNDILYSNYLSHIAFMSNEDIDEEKIIRYIDKFNSKKPNTIKDNYMSIVFSDTYFSREDCKLIGYVRESIEKEYLKKKINERERAVLITSLLYSMDKIANTCGHYDSYRKGVEYEKHLCLTELNLEKKAIATNQFFYGDANFLVHNGTLPRVDCVYCDPPYNSRNYCDLYHVLENVARWEKPEVLGVAKKMDRTSMKSKYCSCQAAMAFGELVKDLDCKYIILSYNNTGDTANDRSNAKMSDDDIIDILSSRGTVKVFSKKYKAFTTGKSENNKNEERLFVCEVQE